MPPLETRDRPHKVLMWPAVGTDAYGTVIVGPGIELDVLWVRRARTVLGPTGDPVATEVMMVTDRMLADKSIVWKGGWDDVPGTGSPAVPTSDFFQVLSVSEADDLKARETRHEATLTRYKDKLPNLG